PSWPQSPPIRSFCSRTRGPGLRLALALGLRAGPRIARRGRCSRPRDGGIGRPGCARPPIAHGFTDPRSEIALITNLSRAVVGISQRRGCDRKRRDYDGATQNFPMRHVVLLVARMRSKTKPSFAV